MNRLKSGVLVKVITGKFRGLIDKVDHLELKKEKVYLPKANRVQYDKSPQVKKKSVKKNILVPIHISNVIIWKEKSKKAKEKK